MPNDATIEGFANAARRWYPQGDPVHGFDHILRVLRLAEQLALAEGADVEIVRAAALLHDAMEQANANVGARGQTPAEAGLPSGPERPGAEIRQAARPAHHHTSAEIAAVVLAGEGWPPERIAAVQHAIRAHRFRDVSEAPQSLEARVLFDADKLDAIGAIGAARAVAYAAQHGQPAYAPPSQQFLETGRLEPGEPHSAYHEFCFKLRRIAERLHTPSARSLAAERHRRMTAFFEQLAEEAGSNFI
jgi:uncharacterized protein